MIRCPMRKETKCKAAPEICEWNETDKKCVYKIKSDSKITKLEAKPCHDDECIVKKIRCGNRKQANCITPCSWNLETNKCANIIDTSHIKPIVQALPLLNPQKQMRCGNRKQSNCIPPCSWNLETNKCANQPKEVNPVLKEKVKSPVALSKEKVKSPVALSKEKVKSPVA
jgi:hypothetical protein